MESTCKVKQNITSVRAFSHISMFNHITPFTVTVPLILLSPSFGTNVIVYEEPLWGFGSLHVNSVYYHFFSWNLGRAGWGTG